jgi:hypothetical protein
LLAAVGPIVIGCAGPTTPPSASPSLVRAPSAAASPSPQRSSTPSLTPLPGSPSPTPAPTRPLTTQTDFGLIWDDLPPSWPTLPGQSQSEVGSDASERLVLKGKPVELARLLATELEGRGWKVDVATPLEDGSVVLDATGPTKGCKAHVVIGSDSPGSSNGGADVYYGATCPWP